MPNETGGAFPACRCRVTRYLGNQAVECVVCRTRYPDGVPADAIMLNHDCEVCRKHVVRFTCDDFAAVPAEHRKFVDDLHKAAIEDLASGVVLSNQAARDIRNKLWGVLGSGDFEVDWSKVSEAIDAGLAENTLPLPPAPDDATTKPEDAWPHAVSWAVSRWNAEVANRPLVNVHRRSLDDTWRQVIRHFGGDPEALCGPSHDELLAANPIVQAGPEKRDLAPNDAVRAAVEAEREACAQIADRHREEHGGAMAVDGLGPLPRMQARSALQACRDVARSIRARKGGAA